MIHAGHEISDHCPTKTHPARVMYFFLRCLYLLTCTLHESPKRAFCRSKWYFRILEWQSEIYLHVTDNNYVVRMCGSMFLILRKLNRSISKSQSQNILQRISFIRKKKRYFTTTSILFKEGNLNIQFNTFFENIFITNDLQTIWFVVHTLTICTQHCHRSNWLDPVFV